MILQQSASVVVVLRINLNDIHHTHTYDFLFVDLNNVKLLFVLLLRTKKTTNFSFRLFSKINSNDGNVHQVRVLEVRVLVHVHVHICIFYFGKSAFGCLWNGNSKKNKDSMHFQSCYVLYFVTARSDYCFHARIFFALFRLVVFVQLFVCDLITFSGEKMNWIIFFRLSLQSSTGYPLCVKP